MEIMAEARTSSRGRVLQLMNAHNRTRRAALLDVIYRKTAKLSRPCRSRRDTRASAAPVRRALAAYGRHLGTAYQLVDDVLDYRSNPQERGKNLGDDLAEGKRPCADPRLKSATKHNARPSAARSNRGLEQLELVWRRSNPPAPRLHRAPRA